MFHQETQKEKVGDWLLTFMSSDIALFKNREKQLPTFVIMKTK